MVIDIYILYMSFLYTRNGRDVGREGGWVVVVEPFEKYAKMNNHVPSFDGILG